MLKGLMVVHNTQNYFKIQVFINVISKHGNEFLARPQVQPKYFLERLVLLESVEMIPQPTIGKVNDDFRKQICKMNGPLAQSLANKAKQAKLKVKEKKEKEAKEARLRQASRVHASVRDSSIAAGASPEASEAAVNKVVETIDAK